MIDILVLRNHNLTATFSPKSGALCTLSDHSGWQWLWNKAPNADYHPHNGGCFAMAPFCNRIKHKQFSWQGKHYLLEQNDIDAPHALHGDAWLSAWQLEKHTEDEIVFSHQGKFGPWHYALEQRYVLHETSVLMELKITHLGLTPMPYGFGFHPWFPRFNDTKLYATASKVWQSSADQIPIQQINIPDVWQFGGAGNTVNGEVDNLFEGWPINEGRCYARLDYPSHKKRLHLHASSNLNRYMLYSSGEDFVCFEPVSHTIDAINRDDGSLNILAQGEQLAGSMLLSCDHYR